MIFIQFLYSIPGYPLGFILYFIYNFICSNVGIAIIIFTFIVKLALLPIYIKQQKSTAKSAVFQPMVQEIQRKYKNNQQKQQEELLKLQQQGFKPMSGCAPMLLSFLILFGVIDVVYKPLTHIVHMNGESITQMVEESYDVELTAAIVEEVSKKDVPEAEITKHENILNDAENILNYYNEHCLKEGDKKLDITVFETMSLKSVKVVKQTIKSAITNEYLNDTSDNKKSKTIGDTDLYRITEAEEAEMLEMSDEEKNVYRAKHSFSTDFTNVVNSANVHFGYYSGGENGASFAATGNMQRELYVLERFGTSTDRYACKDGYSESIISAERKSELTELYENLNFIGIPLGQVPKDHMGFPMILVPIISFLLALGQTFLSQWTMKKSNPDMPAMAGPMKITMYIMPLFSLWIAFTVPAGAGFYWAISYAFGIIQTLLLNKLYNPTELREKALAEYNEMVKKTAKSKKKTIEAEAVKVVNADGNEETISQKELNRRKLAEARKAQAEKYGEEYHED